MWIDTTLSDRFRPGYEYVFRDGGMTDTIFADKFQPAKGFHNPLVLGFETGDLQIFWFDTESNRTEVTDALKIIIATNKDSPTGHTGHNYVIQTSSNIFCALLYRTLEPVSEVGESESTDKHPELVRGVLARATGTKQSNFFTNQYVTLDMHSGKLRFFKGPHH